MVRKPRKRRHSPKRTPTAPDHVATLRLSTILTPAGETVRSPTAVETMWFDPDDPEAKRTVKGLRAISPLDATRSAKITKVHRHAAARFVDTVEALAGSAYGSRASLPSGLPAHHNAAPSSGISHAAYCASADWRETTRLLGASATRLLVAVLIDGTAVADVESASPRFNLGKLVSALDRLVEIYA